MLLLRNEANESIDEQTWADLYLDDIFSRLDNTRSSLGELKLYQILRTPVCSSARLGRRDEIMTRFQTDSAAREQLFHIFSNLGRARNVHGVADLLWGDLPNPSRFAPLFSVLAAVSAVLLTTTIALSATGTTSTIGIGLCFLLFVTNLVIHYWNCRNFDARVWSIKYVGKMIVAARAIARQPIAGLNDVTQVLERDCAALKAVFLPASSLAPEYGNYGDVLVLLREYASIFFLRDVRAFHKILKVLHSRRSQLQGLADGLGLLDAMLAVASFRAGARVYSSPRFTAEGRVLDVRDLVHPLLTAPVTNSIVLADRGCLVTGPNMAGKSTFLRSVGVVVVMAQTVATCCAASYRASFFQVTTSLTNRDDLLAGKSYYLVEADRLLAMIRGASGRVSSLYLIDEILRGTSTRERVSISEEILCYLAGTNALVMAATHDVELVERLAYQYERYYFDVSTTVNDLCFDYRLRVGTACQQTAIALLEMLGYPREIIERARSRCASVGGSNLQLRPRSLESVLERPTAPCHHRCLPEGHDQRRVDE